MKIKLLLASFMLMGMAFSSSAQDAGQMPPLPKDPAVKMGKLANGLTYYVRHNDYPEKRVNFYIAQRVGSIQEEESQRGLAHFLEHMAFNGTDNYPGNGVIDYTRTLGVEFGRDLNAYTSVDQTVYNINDVPSTRQSALDSCLLILRDWSCGLLLEGDEIDKERGVIHEEWRLRSSAMQRMYERNLETLYPDSKYGKRMPIGLMSVVDNFKYDELRNYYKKWYLPHNQAIIVVGDIDVDYTVNKIEELFSPIAMPENAAQVVDEPVPDNAEAIIVIDKDKEQPYSIVELLFKHDPIPDEMKGTLLYLATEYMTDMISNMLNQRLAEKAQEPDCPYTQAGAYDSQYIFSKTKDAFTLIAMPKEGQAAEALNAILTEALRAQRHGFTATEYARAKADYLSDLEKQYNNRNQISNEKYGRSYAANYLENEPIPGIEIEYQYMNMLAPNIPVDAINEIMQEFVSPNDSNLVVMCFNQDKETPNYPTKEGLKAAIENARNSEIEAYVDNVKDEPLITEMPAPGKIVKETTNDKLGYKELELSNGAKVILKKTDFKDDEIKMLAESRGGSSLYGEADFANTTLFSAFMQMSGLGNFDYTELDKALAGKNASAHLGMDEYYENVTGQSTVKDLETLFQLTYLNFTAIKKDEKSTGQLMSMLETTLKDRGLQPEVVFNDSVQYTLANHSWRGKPFTVEELKNVDYDRILQIAKERTANAADFTFYFVGNFDEETIRPLIEQYIASLPANGKKENYINVDDRPLGKVVNQFTRKSETPKAIARMSWYNVKEKSTLENRIKADIAGQILSKTYLKKIREEASAAYTAGARGQSTLKGDRNVTGIMGYCPMQPEKSDLALQIMRDEMNNLPKNIDEGTLNEIKELLIKDADTNARENSHWLHVLSMWIDQGIDVQTNYKDIVKKITSKDISKFVKDVILKPGNAVEVIMLPEE